MSSVIFLLDPHACRGGGAEAGTLGLALYRLQLRLMLSGVFLRVRFDFLHEGLSHMLR